MIMSFYLEKTKRRKSGHDGQHSTNRDKWQVQNRYGCLSKPAIIFLFLFLFLPLSATFAEEDLDVLGMYYWEDEIVVTPTRNPKPLSQTAENVTIITAKEIEEMNAHTLAEVLNYITGVNVDAVYANSNQTHILGSQAFQVKILLDGVELNDLSTNFWPVDAILVQEIERVEIIKGPASSSWGSSLGGVINIITKSGAGPKLGGTVSGSYGQKKTGDYRAEVYGSEASLGYYLSADKFRSDGLFLPHTQFDKNDVYAKLSYDFTEKVRLLFTLGSTNDSAGITNIRGFNADCSFDVLFSTLSMNYRVTDSLDIDLSLRTKILTE